MKAWKPVTGCLVLLSFPKIEEIVYSFLCFRDDTRSEPISEAVTSYLKVPDRLNSAELTQSGRKHT